MGWDIEYENAEPPREVEFYEPSICYGCFHGSYKGRILIQPVWISKRERAAIRTPLDKDSALQKMLDLGLRAIKTSIDRWWKGLIEVDAIEKPSMEPKYIIR